MAKRAKYVVRIVTRESEMDTISQARWGGHTLKEFIECLRYAGLVRIHRDNDEGMCFDLLPPEGVDSETWAGLNARRMASFGYNAVVAPIVRG